jgi:phosphomannomutase/phosphoglucomutase
MSHFGTNGVRGRFDELTPALAMSLSAAIGAHFGKGRIIVARDCRLTGPPLLGAVVSGLSSVGCEVADIGVASSPTAEFMIGKLSAAGCVIISASHNPPEWNALKVVDGDGVAVSRERGAEIEKLLGKEKLSPWDKVGAITQYDMADADHISAIASRIDGGRIRQKKPRLVLDCGNGTACMIAPRLFRTLGCDIITINSHPDGRFPGRPSEPTEANVKELMGAVVSSGADAGVAWDGDGDRVIFVDEKGRYVIGDKVCALSVLWKAAGTGGKLSGDVVTTAATSRCVEDVAERCGAKVRYTAIGAPYLSEEMKARPGALAGEEVGGVIWPELSMAKDGFYTAAKMAEALALKPLSKWLAQVPEYSNVKLKIEADERGKKEMVARVLAHAEKRKLAHIRVDGVRINFDRSWVIVRASGTEPYVRVFAEAETGEEALRLAEEFRRIARG